MPASAAISITIDTTAPTLSLPSDMTVQATSSSGAVVTFTATATDNVDGTLTPTCSPASGSTFPIGTTTVNCSATDTAGNTATGSFTVTVEVPVGETIVPTVSITGPADGSNIARGTGVTITVSAFDSSGISKVQIYVDGKLKTTDTSAPYSYTLATKNLKFGTHTIRAVAYDIHGNGAQDTISFTIVR